jgi:hypothetical protein
LESVVDFYKENFRFITPIQQQHNNLLHEGGSYILELTLM